MWCSIFHSDLRKLSLFLFFECKRDEHIGQNRILKTTGYHLTGVRLFICFLKKLFIFQVSTMQQMGILVLISHHLIIWLQPMDDHFTKSLTPSLISLPARSGLSCGRQSYSFASPVSLSSQKQSKIPHKSLIHSLVSFQHSGNPVAFQCTCNCSTSAYICYQLFFCNGN